MRYLIALLAGIAVAFTAPLSAQEKKQLPKGQKEQPAKGKKKAAKKPAAKKQAANQEWGRFNAGAQKDLDELEKKKKAGK